MARTNGLLMMAHALLAVIMVLRLSTAILVLAGIKPPSILQSQGLPRAEMWEFFWLASVLPMLFGFLAIRRNTAFLLQQYIVGCFIFGFMVTIFAINQHLRELVEYWETSSTNLTFKGFPMVVLWYFFLIIAVQVHACECYFGFQLLRAWDAVHRSKKRN